MSQKTNLDELSSSEIKKMRDNQTTFMKEQLEHLDVQDKYSSHKANIAENTLREYMSKLKLAQLKAPAEPESTKDS
jgi:hypothetical protein